MLGNPERGGRVAGCRCAADEDGKGGFHYFRTYADLAQLEQLHGVGNITCHTPYKVVANVMKTAELPGKNPQEEVFRAAEALMKQIAIATRKLRQLGVARTERPISDYVEWVVSEKLGLRLNSNPIEQGFDAVDTDGKRYQIKSRMIPKRSGNTGFDNIESHNLTISSVHSLTLRPTRFTQHTKCPARLSSSTQCSTPNARAFDGNAFRGQTPRLQK